MGDELEGKFTSDAQQLHWLVDHSWPAYNLESFSQYWYTIQHRALAKTTVAAEAFRTSRKVQRLKATLHLPESRVSLNCVHAAG